MISSPTILAILEWLMGVALPGLLTVTALVYAAEKTGSPTLKNLAWWIRGLFVVMLGLKAWVASGIPTTELAKMGPSRAGWLVIVPLAAAVMANSLFSRLTDHLVKELLEAERR